MEYAVVSLKPADHGIVFVETQDGFIAGRMHITKALFAQGQHVAPRRIERFAQKLAH